MLKSTGNESASSPHRPGHQWDRLGIGISFLCLVHCLAPPLLAALAPAASRLFGFPEWFHLLAFMSAIPVTSIALLRGYRNHGDAWSVVMAGAGVALIGMGAVGGLRSLVEAGVTIIGSLTLAVAHLRNWRLTSRAAS